MISDVTSHFSGHWLDQFYNHTPNSYIAMWKHTKRSGPKSQAKREQKRRPKPKDGSVLFCGVCGDIALGYNFDAISCESCKAFFRRNALKTKPFTCSFDGSCKLDPHTRKFCSGCRLKKCISIGMKKDWILNEEQLVKRRHRQSIRQLKNSASSNGVNIQPCSSTTEDMNFEEGTHHNSNLPPIPQHTPCTDTEMKEFASYRDSHSSMSFSSHPRLKRPYYDTHSYPSSPTSTMTSPHSTPCTPLSQGTLTHMTPPSTSPLDYAQGVGTFYERSSPALTHNRGKGMSDAETAHQFPPDSVLKQPKQERLLDDERPCGSKRHLEASPKLLRPAGSHIPSVSSTSPSEHSEDPADHPIPLNPCISETITSMMKLYDDIFESTYTSEQALQLKKLPKNANQLYNMTDLFVRRLIRFAKNIPEFTCLSQTDQIHLLKGGIMEMYVLRSALSYSAKLNGWTYTADTTESNQVVKENSTSRGSVSTEAANCLGSSMMKQHITFVREIQKLTNKDRKILLLMVIIELMSPDRAHLSDRATVSLAQERHSMLLKVYLESIYSIREGRALYPKLLMKLLDVRSLSEESTQMARELDISVLQPLLAEIFDIG